MLSGDNGVLQRATDAKTKSDEAQIRERIRLAYNSALTKDITNQNGEVQKSTLEGELENEFPNKTIEITDSANKKEWIITIDEVTENVPIGKDTKVALKLSEHKNEKFETNTELEDNFGNKITVPIGFKITSDSPNSVTDGIVIEDVDAGTTETVGSQFVWIPVGTVYTNSHKTESKTIPLARYYWIPYEEFDASLLKTQIADQIPDNEYYYIEETTFREGSVSENINATALNISEFISNARNNGGYYIGRYEARTETKRISETDNLMKMTEKQEDYVYNYITQMQASKLSREMYTNSNFTSDLINSFAWDTAILFLQEFGVENYAINYPTTYSFSEKGTNNDKVCNVFDMANNLSEWSTETYSNSERPYVARGGYYYNSSWAGGRNGFTPTAELSTFRPILYVK